ncbi:MAG TPA: CopG family transcriptional regulator [Propionibacteriaceae bacterium]|nr:CopG family transcriptional regulator [Propionibacteriaceae bacterium]
MAMTLRLEPEDERALTLLAEAEGVSKQEATVRAIREAAARRVREDKVSRLSAAARSRYADLLDRLGQ